MGLAGQELLYYIFQARHGCFHQVLSASLLPAMLEGGIIFILRWALDDSTDNTMSAAITVLHAFVISDTDEVWHCLKKISKIHFFKRI